MCLIFDTENQYTHTKTVKKQRQVFDTNHTPEKKNQRERTNRKENYGCLNLTARKKK